MRAGDLLEQRYRLSKMLGRGRSGSVWAARNELIDRAVAIKILHPSLAGDPERVQRFFQEARSCGRVRHPAVVEVLDLGQGEDGVLFIVMELLEGETLSSLLSRRGALQPDEALGIVIPLARGLAAAHSQGIVHRDLKPANIYLHKTPLGGLQPKILDFGISKILGNELTQGGVVLGTPSYMSPEQARGVRDLDAATDVWSLGVILYELLSGRLPFASREYRTLVAEILDQQPPPLSSLAPDVPKSISEVVEHALEKTRERRLASVALMAQRLTAVLAARGRIDLVRDADDLFSESAPTLMDDRESRGLGGVTSRRASREEVAEPKDVQDSWTLRSPSPDLSRPPDSDGDYRAPSGPSPRDVVLDEPAARASEEVAHPRPAAGTPPPSPSPHTGGSGDVADGAPNEAHPAVAEPPGVLSPPLAITAPAETQEVPHLDMPVGEPPLTSGLPPATYRVDEDWDTTVADIAEVLRHPRGDEPQTAPQRAGPRPAAGAPVASFPILPIAFPPNVPAPDTGLAARSVGGMALPESAPTDPGLGPPGSSIAGAAHAGSQSTGGPQSGPAHPPNSAPPGLSRHGTLFGLAPDVPASAPSSTQGVVPMHRGLAGVPTPAIPPPATPTPFASPGHPTLAAPHEPRTTSPYASPTGPAHDPWAAASPDVRAPSPHDAAPKPPRSRPPRPPPKTMVGLAMDVRPSGYTAVRSSPQVARASGAPHSRGTSPGRAAPPLAALESLESIDPFAARGAPPSTAPSFDFFDERAGAAGAQGVFVDDVASASAQATSTNSSVTSSAHRETVRLARGKPAIPLIVAVGVLFMIGAFAGTWAASSRSTGRVVSRALRNEAILYAWHDREVAAAERAALDDANARALAAAQAEAEEAARAKGAADAKAAADAAAAASASAARPKPTWRAAPTGKPKTSAGGGGGSGATKTPGKATKAPKTSKGDTSKTKKPREKEWWEKKF